MRVLPCAAGANILRLSTIVFCVAMTFLLFVVLARFLPLPFAVFTVASGSMEPSIRVLDVAVVFGRGFGVGDVVVWCSTPWYCVMHRVVNVSSDYIVTKGDANPVPDPPVPRSLVRGRVVLVVPRELWLPPAALLIGFAVYSYRRAIASALTPALVPLAMYIAVMAVAVALIAPQTGFSIEAPELHLARAYVEDRGYTCIAVVEYLCRGVELMSVANLKVFNKSTTPLQVSGTSIAFALPEDMVMVAVARGLKINVSVEAVLTRGGFLKGSYQLALTPPKPGVRVVNSSLLIENPSCYPVAFNVTWMYAEVGEPWRYISTRTVVKGGSTLLKPPVNASYIYVDVRYFWMGGKFFERLRVR